jgi:hypothetical protein
MRTLLATTSLLLLAAPAVHAQAAPAAKPKEAALLWGPAPDAFPPRAKMAVVAGDPTKPARFTIQLRMPDGYTVRPHFHPNDESVTVKQGTFLFGMGDTFDASKAKAMNAGDKGSVPAKMHHFATAKGVTIVEVSAMGPFAITYVNPADDPRKQAAKP